MKNSLNRFAATIACAVLTIGLTLPAQAAEAHQPYTIQTAQWSREDFSQDANPDVFTATYDRALYNAIRQTLVDGTSDTAPAYTMVGDSEYSAVKNLLAPTAENCVTLFTCVRNQSAYRWAVRAVEV